MWSLRHVLKIPNSSIHVYMQTCKRLVNRRLINSWILSLRKFLIKRQIIEYYSKKCLYTCKVRPPTTPTPQTPPPPHHKKQQQQNNQQKQKQKSPKQKNHSQSLLRIQKFKKSWLFHIWNYINLRYIEVPWLSLLPPQPPPPSPGISVDNKQLQRGYLLQWHTIIQCNSMSGIWNIKNFGLWFNTRKKLVKTSEDLMWVCNIFFHSYYVTGEIVLMI